MPLGSPCPPGRKHRSVALRRGSARTLPADSRYQQRGVRLGLQVDGGHAERGRQRSACPPASVPSRPLRPDAERRVVTAAQAPFQGCCRGTGSARFPAVKSEPQWRRLLPLHRSEEHTSELQSLMRISYAVFCLKKKKI